MSAQKRITKEFADCSSSPPDGVSVKLVDEASLYKWDVTVEGPPGTPYQGGTFHLNLSFPLEYPFKPPVVSFTTKIYHPNVTNDDKGSMCLGMLRPDQWKPPNKVAAVLLLVRQLLVEPDTDNAVEAQIADQYKNNKKEFEKNVKDWVKRYASGKK